MYNQEEWDTRVEESEMILVGVGEEFQSSKSAKECYEALYNIVQGKNYFIVSQCTDDVIYEGGFDRGRIVTPCGGVHKKQCPNVCNESLYDVSESICPICHEQLVFNNINAKKYIETDYLPQWDKYMKWLAGSMNRKLLVIELGVSMKYPTVIRWPFEKTVFVNQKSFLYRINESLPQIPVEIVERATAIHDNSSTFLHLISKK